MNDSRLDNKKGFFRLLWDGINFTRRLIVNLVFLLLVLVFVGFIFGGKESVEIADRSALVLNPVGKVVEQKQFQDPVEEYLSEQFSESNQADPEVLLSDLIMVIDRATSDNKIAVMVLDLKGLGGSGLNKLKTIGEALDRFKQAGKKIIAIGDYYTQGQYYLASYADEITLNPMGGVLIDGFGIQNLYYKDALEKLKVTQHIFKVGKFKSAVEPYDRNDMSDEAKQANRAWLQELWSNYKQDVATQRNMDIGNFDENLDIYLHKMQQSNGDMAQYALQYQWVDSLKSREEILTQLIEMVGKDSSNSYNRVSLHDYLSKIKPAMTLENPLTDKIGVVVASGTILDGSHKAGTVGGDSTAKLLRKARLDDNIKAVVLRVDSPGGSAFASEVIRQEIDQLQAAGKPVVASMSSVAASGGYWISVSADEIWASPTTITGSIGIYGMFMTFENSLKALGISSDGVATTEMANMSAFRPLAPKLGDIIQLNIERGYQRFIALVAKHRKMDIKAVDEVAQGRVWTGAMAQKLGLVDHLGSFNDAVAAAAKLASLSSYDTKYVELELSTKDQFYRNLLGVLSPEQQKVGLMQNAVGQNRIDIQSVVGKVRNHLNMLTRFNDPQYMYVHCEVCEGF